MCAWSARAGSEFAGQSLYEVCGVVTPPFPHPP